MIGIVVVGHGRLAEGVLHAARMIVGELGGVRGVSLREMDDVEGLLGRVEAAVDEVAVGGEGVLILVDLFGASPFNVSARLARGRDDLEVVTGVNLPMVLELVVRREGRKLAELTAIARRSGVEGVHTLSEILDEGRGV
jgi:mannose/fructose/sorbose-specific phosphotransferase system IIA component